MTKNWWFPFEFRIWRTDTALRRCSLETRAFWIEVLCIMHETDKSTLTGSPQELARLIGCESSEVMKCATELKQTETADVTLGNGFVTIVSRRRNRELSDREQTRLRVRKHRGNADVTTHNKSNNKNKKKEEDKRDAVASDTQQNMNEFSNDFGYPVQDLINAFPDYLPDRLTSAMIGFFEAEVLPADAEAWRRTIEIYQMNFNPMTKSYLPDKTANVLGVFRKQKAEVQKENGKAKTNGNAYVGKETRTSDEIAALVTDAPCDICGKDVCFSNHYEEVAAAI